MTMICGWLPKTPDPNTRDISVVTAMGNALRSHDGQGWGNWRISEMEIGLLESENHGPVQVQYAPAVSDGGRYHLWFAGEAFAGEGFARTDATYSRTHAFRQDLLATILADGDRAVRSLDGEYVIVLWDARALRLVVYNDRFGGLSLYWGKSEEGFAFATGVRGVLMAPGVSASPDRRAIREAVTFGGYRLGNRTNVEGVKMVSGGTVMEVSENGVPTFRRYWHWKDITDTPVPSRTELIEELQRLWRQAIQRRLVGAARPGQTLSGGLDSRAILAEAAPRANQWTAITYGLSACDDARYAQRAAAAVNADWLFHPLYSGRNPDWLEKRSSYIQCTDGLIDLADLMHLETLPQQAGLLDVHLSGYIGDAVSGPTFNDVSSIGAAVGRMPRYATSISLRAPEILEIEKELAEELNGAPSRFAVFEHKLPQSTNRWSAAWRPWFRVRKPFVDYDFFDFCQGLPNHVRGEWRIHERWLRASYPELFSRIPNQATGVPVLSPRWRWRAAQAGRLTWRKVQPILRKSGITVQARVRNYQADDVIWSLPEYKHRISDELLREGSLVCDIFGRGAVQNVLHEYFECRLLPTQAIGAMYVYEFYHRNLEKHLRNAAQAHCSNTVVQERVSLKA